MSVGYHSPATAEPRADKNRAVQCEVGSYRTADIAGSDVDRYQEQRLPLQEGGAGTAIQGAPLPGKDSGIGAGLGHIESVGICALRWAEKRHRAVVKENLVVKLSSGSR